MYGVHLRVRPLSNRTGAMTRVLEGKSPARALTLGSRLFRPTSHHGNTHVLAFLALTPRQTWVAVRLQHARTVQSGPPMREAATLPAPPNATCGLPRRRPPSGEALQPLRVTPVVPGCLQRAKDPAGLHRLLPSRRSVDLPQASRAPSRTATPPTSRTTGTPAAACATGRTAALIKPGPAPSQPLYAFHPLLFFR